MNVLIVLTIFASVYIVSAKEDKTKVVATIEKESKISVLERESRSLNDRHQSVPERDKRDIKKWHIFSKRAPIKVIDERVGVANSRKRQTGQVEQGDLAGQGQSSDQGMIQTGGSKGQISKREIDDSQEVRLSGLVQQEQRRKSRQIANSVSRQTIFDNEAEAELQKREEPQEPKQGQVRFEEGEKNHQESVRNERYTHEQSQLAKI